MFIFHENINRKDNIRLIRLSGSIKARWAIGAWYRSLAYVTCSQNLKKNENSLCCYFFERNPNLQSELRNSEFEKLTSHMFIDWHTELHTARHGAVLFRYRPRYLLSEKTVLGEGGRNFNAVMHLNNHIKNKWKDI